MKISPQIIVLLFLVNILLGLVCAFLRNTRYFFDDLGILWQIPLVISFVSVIFLVFSRIAETIINRPNIKYKVYFWGQALVTVFIFGNYAWLEIRSANYQKNQANIDYNERFVSSYEHTKTDSIRLRALKQLEATCANSNDLLIDFCHTEKIDSLPDSVYAIDFTYTHKDYPGISLCSKHMIGDKTEELVYHNIPASEMESVQKYISEMDEKVLEVSKYRMNDSLNKNERKLLEEALKRVEERQARRSQ